MKRRLGAAWVLTSLVTMGCGERAAITTDGAMVEKDQRVVDGYVPKDMYPIDTYLVDAPIYIFDAGPPPDHCMVGIRVDNCCTMAEPVTFAEMANDPCIVPYPPQYPLPPQCGAQWDPQCDYIDCTFSPPPSRKVAPTADGGCRFADECLRPADCVLARDFFRCCACADAYPLSMVEEEPCLIPVYQSHLPAECNNPECATIDCAPCPRWRGRADVTCQLRDSYSRCVFEQ